MSSMFNSDVCAHGLYNYCAKCEGTATTTATTYTKDIFETVMSSPTIEKKVIRLAGPRVLGFRAFRVDDNDSSQLHGMAQGSWNVKGDMPAATCARGVDHPQGEPIPSLNCSCGWHAYKTLDAMRADTGDPSLRRPSDVWVGAVIGWGRIAPHVDGWRAEHARLVALMGASHLNGEAIAEKFGVPLFRFEYPVGGDMNGFAIGGMVKTAYGAGVIVGATTSSGVNYLRVAINGHIRRFRDINLLKVDPMPDITDGATRMYRGHTFEESYAKASAALAAFAQQFGTPLDEIDARYRVAKHAAPVVAGIVVTTTNPVPVAPTITNVNYLSRLAARKFARAAARTARQAISRQSKKLYDTKWRLAKLRDAHYVGAAKYAMAKFKSDWAAGLVTDAWRP